MTAQPDLSVARSQSHKLDTAKTSFLDLPRELRDLIYAHIFHVPGAIFLYKEGVLTYSATFRAIDVRFKAKNVRYRNHGPTETQCLSQTGVSTALLRSCRQLHAEACPVFYSDNVFRIVQLAEGTFNLALPYRLLVRRVVVDDLYYKIHRGTPDLDHVHHWQFKLWPIILLQSGKMLDRFPNIENLAVPIKVGRRETDWMPACFKLGGEMAEARVELAARWMLKMSPLRDERLRDCLHLELEAPPGKIWREEYAGSRFAPDEEEWDYKEFEDAFELMKVL
jgi:hypothetical protein